MENYEDYYLELINPNNLINHFKTMDEFRSWCEAGDYESLKCTLESFIKEELYLHCCVIRDTINELQVKKLLIDK